MKPRFACCSLSQLGAIRFDRDLRSITTYLASQTAFGDAREKFVRLQQISTLLNLDSVSDVAVFPGIFILNITAGRGCRRILQQLRYHLETDLERGTQHCSPQILRISPHEEP